MKLFISNPGGGGATGTASITGGTATGLTSLGIRSTGAAFDLTLASSEVLTAGRTLSFNVGDANRTLTIPATGTVALLGTAQSFTAAQTISVNGAASTPPLALTGTIFTGGSATTTKPALLIEPSGTTSTGWSTSGTGLGINLASGFTGNLLDLQKNGVRVFGVSDDGTTTACTGRSGTRFVLYDFYARMGAAGTDYLSVRNVATVELINGCALGFAAATSADLYLHREAAGTLAQRNSTNAQTTRIYGTYTDASNYRRLAISSTTGGTFSIAPEGAGTGASGNVLHISGLPTSNPGPGILWNNAGTPAIGT